MTSLTRSNFSMERARAAFGKQTTSRPERAPYYPFYKLPEGKSSTLRFIPDANPDNEMGFLVERKRHELFVDGEKVTVDCLESHGEDCPICTLSRQYYKAKDTVNGKRYWPKKDYMARAIVVKDGLPPDPETGETFVGKVVTLFLAKTLYEIIAHNISSGDLGDDLPCSVENGTDFVITRSTKPGPEGQKYSDYSLSKFARANRPLEEEEVATIEFEDDNGSTPNFINLRTLMGKKPTLEYVENLLEASLSGGSLESVADRPASKPAAAAKPATRVDADEEVSAPKASPKPAAAAKPAVDEDEEDAEAFLAQMRARRAQRSSADE